VAIEEGVEEVRAAVDVVEVGNISSEVVHQHHHQRVNERNLSITL